MDTPLAPHFERHCNETSVVSGETLVGKIPGRDLAPPVQVLAHKDEIGMIVKRIDPDGVLHVDALGSAQPWRYGEGPVRSSAIARSFRASWAWELSYDGGEPIGPTGA